MEAKNAIKALNMALSQLPISEKETIHHSDRGGQYCSYAYVKVLTKNKIKISMTESGDPRENAIAERVNGILKEEWLNDLDLQDLLHADQEISRVIQIYNSLRPHCSVDMLTPNRAHDRQGVLPRHWKNYWGKTSNNKPQVILKKEKVNLYQDLDENL